MKIYKILIILLALFFCNSVLADPDNDQWKDSDKTYLDLINEGYEVKAYDMNNFKDSTGAMYMFFVTVLQKENKIYECQEYQVFDEFLNTLDLSFVCRELVQPFKKGLKT
tara:strand:+ start:80 stop:409 length:330 start_codon:yes stop_codon:yes gene_type:complete